MPWYGMIFGPIMMIAVLATVVVVVVLIVRWLGGGSWGTPLHDYRQPPKTALDVLKERFAKGEIEKDGPNGPWPGYGAGLGVSCLRR